MSVAMEVCRMAEERLGPDRSDRLRVVGIQVGNDAGLEPANLAFCLDALLSHPPFGAAHTQLTRCAGDVLRLDFLEVDDGHPDDRRA
jgi:Zn finger protein HypA/HybF involved in hydrogenase expression